jgi:uncharacterized membrane protein YsdA (DUF1294 family)/cold shock CspA family protein
VRVQGTLSDWKERQGFGFITPDGSGERVFVHQSAFLNRKRQPAAGAQVLYELAPHKSRGVCASKVAYVMDAAATRGAGSRGGSTSWLALAFLALLAAITFKGYLPAGVLAFYLVESVISYFAYAMDKSSAQGGRWRIAENTLHLFDLLGGWPGGLIAQKRLRHKTSKDSFQNLFWVSVAVNCAVLVWFFTAPGKAFLLEYF